MVAGSVTGSWRWACKLAFVAAAYYGAARLGLMLELPGTKASPVWPPSGIGLAAVLLFGLRICPAITAGAFLANLLTLPEEYAGTPAGYLAASAIAVGNTLEHIVGVVLIRRLVRAESPFERANDIFRFVGIAAVSCAVASTNGTATLWLAGIIPGKILESVWFTWWLGDTAGMLILTPALYCWCRQPRLKLSTPRILELAVLTVLTAGTAEVLFGGWVANSAIGSRPYLAVPVLLWAAFRFGPRETSSLAVLLSVVAIGHT
jgi:integral membrane sensor domain MASE1